MKTTNRRRVILYMVLTLLFVMACDLAYLQDGVVRKVGEVECTSLGFNNPIFGNRTQTAGIFYICKCPIDGKQYTTKEFSSGDLIDPAKLKEAACVGYVGETNDSTSNNPAPTEEATEAPTEAPTDAPQPAALKPYLAGTVTACDTYSRYINFPVRADAPAGAPPKIILNGAAVNCSLANNNTILSCSYPQGLPFPIRVIALVNDQAVNDFSFDGAICTSLAPQGSQGGEGEQGPSGPAPVIDCSLFENWYLPECNTD